MSKLKYFLLRILAYIPTPLPRGMTEYKAWEASIVSLANNLSTNDDLRWIIAAETMRLAPTRSLVPKAYFLRVMRVAAAKQLAGAVFSDLKEKQKAAAVAAQAAEAAKASTPTNTVEATTPIPGVVNATQTKN